MFRLLIPMWQLLALNSIVFGDYQKVEKYFRRIHRYVPDRGGFEYNLGLIKLAQNNYKEALEAFPKVVEQDNTTFQALNNKGSILFHNYKDSLDCFDWAISLSLLPAIKSNILKAGEALGKGNIDEK